MHSGPVDVTSKPRESWLTINISETSAAIELIKVTVFSKDLFWLLFCCLTK